VLAAVQRVGGVAPMLALRSTENCNLQTLASAWQAKLGEISLAVLAALYPDALPPARRSADNGEPER
jgi:hypothetical protein